MEQITAADKQFAKRLATLFGGQPSVRAHLDEAERPSVDILSCVNAPSAGLTIYATLNLHKHRNLVGSPPKDVRVEIVGICDTAVTDFNNAVATAAACVVNSKWTCAPGVAFPDVISMYKISRTMSHVVFFPPTPWNRELGSVQVGHLTVHCLAMIPISESEYRFLEREGSDELESLLAAQEVDFADINRLPVV